MSKFADKLRNLSKSSAAPIGFRPSVSETKGPTMLLVLELPRTQPKEGKTLAEVKADAGLILGDVPGAKAFKQMVEAAGEIPVGVVIKRDGGRGIDDLVGEGCDFVVFDIGMGAAVLDKEGVGKFMMIERSLDQGLVRAINGLEVDGVLVASRDSFLAVEDLLVYRRFVELLEKPVIMGLPPAITKAELTALWEIGVDGVVASSTYSAEALAELRKMINDLPAEKRGRRCKGGVVLPRYSVGVADEEEGEEEEDEDI
jgi:hypothetical protein